MTIAAGFICTDGVVLASDTQWTGAIKRQAAKTWPLAEGDNFVGLASAGDGDLISRAKYDIETQLTSQMSHSQILQLADDVVYRMWVKDLKDDENADLELLLAIRTPPSSLLLFECRRAKRFSPLIAKVQCIGIARSLGLYLMDRYFDGSTMRVARSVAAYMLQQTKRYDPENSVGGESQILLIPAELSVAPDFVEQHKIHELEEQISRIDSAMRRAIALSPGLVGVDVNPETRAMRDAAIDSAANAAGSATAQLTGWGSKGELGTLTPHVDETPPPKDEPKE